MGGLLPLLFGAVLAACPGPAAAAEPLVRVLLRETAEPVRVAANRAETTITTAGDALRADGRPVGPVWRIAAAEPGSLRVGALRVRGEVEIARVPGGVRIVNRLPLESYVAGTVAREIYTHWNSETLKAQAVVTRTYALYERARKEAAAYDLRADTSSQVYGGVDAEGTAVRAAVEATRGEYLAHRGEPILAVFHSASGGRTASAGEVWGRSLPYLVSVEVPYEENSPDTYWRASISRTTLERALLGGALGAGSPGAVEDVRVVERSASGRALRVRIRGAAGSRDFEARALRSALGDTVIRSTLFDVVGRPDAFVFVGSGHGHGVGMSQWGAQAMAERGADYCEILERFYPGTRLAVTR